MIPILKDYRNVISQLHSKNSAKDLSSVYKILTKIRKDVLKDRDKALKKYALQFDKVNLDAFSLKVTKNEINKAYKRVPKDYIDALKRAKSNIEAYHQHQLPKDWHEKKEEGIEWGMLFNPVDLAGLYVPGGRAPYPSSVLMNAIPAKLAGVKNIIMATPPQRDGSIAPQILVAADICGVKNIVKVGGSQAIFALALGTESVDKVDKIVGPGNIYVTTAKQMVYGQVDIDKPAGPSEALVYINNQKYAAFAASELLAQLEHDPNAVAAAVSEDKAVLELIQKELKNQINNCSRQEIINQSLKNSALFLVENQAEVIDAINRIASEHLILLVDEYRDVLKKIKHAGAIFLGPYTPVALGDYYGGTNHVLPTSGTARFASALNVMDFFKFSSVLYYSKEQLKKAQPDTKILTQMEGFDAHYKTIKIRLEE